MPSIRNGDFTHRHPVVVEREKYEGPFRTKSKSFIAFKHAHENAIVCTYRSYTQRLFSYGHSVPDLGAVAGQL
jgi:hypothetical protein